jgi:hypothetical protein
MSISHKFWIGKYAGRKMAANLSKANAMGSCINGHLNKNDSTMSDSGSNQDKVVILDAGAQYGKVFRILLLM